MNTRIFTIGDKVRAKAFTDCYSQYHPAVFGLVVFAISTVGPDKSTCPHHRLAAHRADEEFNGRWIEGAEDHFERED